MWPIVSIICMCDMARAHVFTVRALCERRRRSKNQWPMMVVMEMTDDILWHIIETLKKCVMKHVSNEITHRQIAL